MIESSSSQLDVEELLEDDDYYDEEDGNEDDMDDELGGLEVPVESLVTVLSNANRSETCKLNWKQVITFFCCYLEYIILSYLSLLS